jgi:hypothetical protein
MGMSNAMLGFYCVSESCQPLKPEGLPNNSLLRRRALLEVCWRRYCNGQPLAKTDVLGEDILSSWQRSTSEIETFLLQAPGDEAALAEAYWQDSQLSHTAKSSLGEIMGIAEEGGLVAGITDPTGRLVWTYTCQPMRKRAEAVNFTLGGYWHERTVGTNAIGLALQLQRPATVFSCEHYQPFVHDWVSYAAPVHYPHSEECIGALCFSTLWDRHTPLGQAAVAELARCLSQGLPNRRSRAELEIYALGQPRVVFRGKRLRLPLRQIEILCLLALNPRGLSLEAFHAALYGDTAVSFSTLKAELSHLRRLLEGNIGSRPYRLQMPVWADFLEIWQRLRNSNCGEALSLYRGSLLRESVSPELEEWRHCIDAVMSQALGCCHDPLLLMDKLFDGSSGSELVRERLFEMMSG